MKKRLMAKILSALMIVSLFTANGGIQPVVAKAAVTVEASTTYSATVNGIVWNYEVDTVGNAINVGPKDRYNLKQFWGDNVKVVIPEALEGKKVTSIRDHAFFECGKVISITIPQGVTKIGNYAFASCLSLKNITIPSGVTSIENNTFDTCWNLLSVSMPNGITSIGENAFNECLSLKSVTIPKAVTSIGASAFMSCESLTSINIPKGVTSIESKLLYDCTSLKSICLPDSLKSISLDAIEGCTNLTTICVEIGSAKFTCVWGPGKINSQIGSISQEMIKDTITKAKKMLADSNTALSSYIKAGGLKTDAVYKNLMVLITIPPTNILIDGDTVMSKLKIWVAEVYNKINALNAEIKKRELKISSFTSNVASPQNVGTGITLSTTTSGGFGTLQTKFTILDGTKLTVLKDYSTEGKVVWTPTKAGTYTINTLVKDSAGKIVTKTLTYVINNPIVPLVIDNFTASVASPQFVGTGITLSTTSIGGIGTLQTKFTILDGTTEAVLKDYSTEGKVVWTPTKSGTYTINTLVKDSTGKEVTKTLTYVINDPLVIDNFTASVASPQFVGTAITLSTTSIGGIGTLQTKFTILDGTTEAVLKDYSTEGIVVWTPTKAGTYTINTLVKDSTGKIVTKTLTYVVNNVIAKNETTIYYKGYGTPNIHYKIGTGSWTKVPGVAMTATTEKPGYTHKITIDLGTSDNLTACFNNGSGNWDSRNGANYTFKAGTYDYCNGTITKMQDFSINSFTSSIIDNLKVGTSVVLQGNAISNASTIQYKMSVINPKNETTIIKDYSTSNISTWTPSEVGDYTLVLDVKDSNGKTLRTEMKLSTYAVSSHITTIYYKGYSTPYIHYKVGAGSWTKLPGIAMIATTDKPGYTHKMTIDLGDADTLTACFNNGSGNWDSRNGANYTFKVGVYTYSNGSSTLIN